MPNAHFDLAHAFTAKWEGGLTDHPADPGGITKYGVSLRFLQAEGLDPDNDGKIDALDVRGLTKEQTAEIFYTHFWIKGKCAALPRFMGLAHYDGAVNMGIGQASKQVQSACNTLGSLHIPGFTPLKEDGCIGPLTLAAVCQLGAVELDYIAAQLIVRLRQAFYRRLAEQRPELQVFLQGWLNRTNDLAAYIAQQAGA